jgi:hypothetical protein
MRPAKHIGSFRMTSEAQAAFGKGVGKHVSSGLAMM